MPVAGRRHRLAAERGAQGFEQPAATATGLPRQLLAKGREVGLPPGQRQGGREEGVTGGADDRCRRRLGSGRIGRRVQHLEPVAGVLRQQQVVPHQRHEGPLPLRCQGPQGRCRRGIRQQPGEQFLVAGRPHRLGLPVVQLGRIVPGRRPAQAGRVESRRHLRQGKHPGLRPGHAQPHQVIEQGPGQVAAAAQAGDAQRPAALGQRPAVRAMDQCQVAIGRRLQAQCGQQQQLARRVGQVVLPAQDLGHPHQGIVHRVAEQEGRPAVTAPHHEIRQAVAGHRLGPAHQVPPADLAPARYPEPQRGRPALRLPPAPLRRIQVAAGAGVTRRPARAPLSFALGGQLRVGAIAGIGVALFQQALVPGRIERQAPGLEIGSPFALPLRALVPRQPQPAQILEQAGQGLGPAALTVAVLDAQQETATGMARPQGIEQGRAGVAQVHRAGGAGREAGAGGTRAHGCDMVAERSRPRNRGRPGVKRQREPGYHGSSQEPEPEDDRP